MKAKGVIKLLESINNYMLQLLITGIIGLVNIFSEGTLFISSVLFKLKPVVFFIGFYFTLSIVLLNSNLYPTTLNGFLTSSFHFITEGHIFSSRNIPAIIFSAVGGLLFMFAFYMLSAFIIRRLYMCDYNYRESTKKLKEKRHYITDSLYQIKTGIELNSITRFKTFSTNYWKNIQQ